MFASWHAARRPGLALSLRSGATANQRKPRHHHLVIHNNALENASCPLSYACLHSYTALRSRTSALRIDLDRFESLAMARPPFKRRKSNQRSPNHTKYIRAPPRAGLEDAPRVELQQKLAHKIVGQKPQDSDDSDRLVTRTRSGRRQHADSQIYASGAVAKGDRPGAFPTKEERRQRLRSDTNEIIRRSRSKSADGTNNSLRQLPVADSGKLLDGNLSLTTTKSLRQPKSPQAMPVQAQATPGADTSIIGTLKPRRRQASILHLIDNDDSSLINPEDEEQFLPDDISTPAANTQLNGPIGSARPINLSAGSQSRKRKLGQEGHDTRSSSRTTTILTTTSTSPLSDPVSIASTPARLRSRTIEGDDDDVMAPPRSSSPESSPPKPQPPALSKSKKIVSVPTTEQLQSMMPSKRRKGSRQRKQLSEFDIPEDTSSDQLDEPEDESIFQPRKRATKSRNRKGTISPKATRTKAKTTGKTVAHHKQTPKSKSTSSASLPAPPVTPRTPLPLTRNTNQENTALARSSKKTGGKNSANVNNHRDRATLQQSGKQSGGSLPTSKGAGLRSRTDAITGGAESDKENQLSGQTQTRSLRKRNIASNSKDPGDVVHPSIEIQEDIIDVDVDDDVEQEVARGTSKMLSSTPVVAKTPMSSEAKLWRSQWANIDDWSLDYEEVSISTSSSSPTRR